ncbi:pantothenate synthetase [Nitrospira sp.]|nr:pantothenate synthetase [Nitrospira sp.]
MRVMRHPHRVSAWSRLLHREGIRIGLVPTMGALHAGHRALIRAARLSCDAVAVSIFVNPVQFGPKEDWSRYPRPFARDVRLCRDEGVDLLFAPSVASMYPHDFQTEVHVPRLATRWEGSVRPGHLSGVATVVTKLLCAVQPAVAYFGQKDFQQAAVVRRLIEDLDFPSRIEVCPTVRESDGLALSSRNLYLSASQRATAPVLYRALFEGARLTRTGSAPRDVRRAMLRICRSARGVTVDYLTVCDPHTLEPLSRLSGRAVVLLGAIRLGSIRLIDNLLVRAPRRRT